MGFGQNEVEVGMMFNDFGGIRIVDNPQHPVEFSHMETVRFEAHPFIKWLARWFPIEPYVEGKYPRYKDCDAIIIGRIVYCSPRQTAQLRREFSR